MIIVLKPEATRQHAEELLARIGALGLTPLHMPGTERVVLGALGDERRLEQLQLDAHPMVESVQRVLAPYKLVSREMHPHDTVVNVGSVPVGGSRLAVMAGPCAVESPEQMLQTAEAIRAAGGAVLRGGAFKPRTSPYSFQGLGRRGLEILRQASEATGLPVVTEVLDVTDVDLVGSYADAFQVGARNMQNYRLLQALGGAGKPVVLKRGMAAKVARHARAGHGGRADDALPERCGQPERRRGHVQRAGGADFLLLQLKRAAPFFHLPFVV